MLITYIPTEAQRALDESVVAGPRSGSRSLLLCNAFTPSGPGPDVGEVSVPHADDGVSVVTWSVERVTLRVEAPGGSPSITVESSTGTGPFSPNTLASVALSPGASEASVTGDFGSVSSGDKLRFNVQALGSAQNWTITVEISRYYI